MAKCFSKSMETRDELLTTCNPMSRCHICVTAIPTQCGPFDLLCVHRSLCRDISSRKFHSFLLTSCPVIFTIVATL